MLTTARLTRRGFIRAGAWTVAAAALGVGQSVVGRLTALQARPRPVAIPADLSQDVTFAGEVIVCRTGDGVRTLSARCTHLGCLITQQSDGLLVCPCHGSRFRPDGTVARGPATRPLKVLPNRVDRATGAIVVDLVPGP